MAVGALARVLVLFGDPEELIAVQAFEAGDQ